jgi:hypothetical protein
MGHNAPHQHHHASRFAPNIQAAVSSGSGSLQGPGAFRANETGRINMQSEGGSLFQRSAGVNLQSSSDMPSIKPFSINTPNLASGAKQHADYNGNQGEEFTELM